MITTKHAPFKVRDTPSVPVEMRRRSKHLWLRMCLASIFGLLPIAASSDEALTINVIVSLTGPAAFVGTDEKNGLQVYESVVNRSGGVRGRPVHFQFLDDTSSPQVTVQLVSGLIEKHVPIFLGPVTTGPCAAAEALVHNAGPVEFCFSPGLQTPKGGFAFAAAQAAEVMAVAQGRFMTDKGYNRVALLVTTDASGQFGSTAIINTLKMYPALQIVDVERFSPTALSISAQIEKLKTFNPQVIFTIAIGPAFGTVLHALHDAGLDVPVFGNNSNINYLLTQSAAFLPKDLYFDGALFQAGGSQGSPAVKKAIATFTDALKNAGIAPTAAIASVWGAASIVVSAYNQLGPDATAEQMHSYLENLHDFVGVNGVYDFRNGDQHGLGPDSVIVVKWSPVTNTVVPASRPGGKTR